MTTLSHQWMATTFYSDETIQTVLSENAVIETGESTNTEEVEKFFKEQGFYFVE